GVSTDRVCSEKGWLQFDSSCSGHVQATPVVAHTPPPLLGTARPANHPAGAPREVLNPNRGPEEDDLANDTGWNLPLQAGHGFEARQFSEAGFCRRPRRRRALEAVSAPMDAARAF